MARCADGAHPRGPHGGAAARCPDSRGAGPVAGRCAARVRVARHRRRCRLVSAERSVRARNGAVREPPTADVRRLLRSAPRLVSRWHAAGVPVGSSHAGAPASLHDARRRWGAGAWQRRFVVRPKASPGPPTVSDCSSWPRIRSPTAWIGAPGPSTAPSPTPTRSCERPAMCDAGCSSSTSHRARPPRWARTIAASGSSIGTVPTSSWLSCPPTTRARVGTTPRWPGWIWPADPRARCTTRPGRWKGLRCLPMRRGRSSWRGMRAITDCSQATSWCSTWPPRPPRTRGPTCRRSALRRGATTTRSGTRAPRASATPAGESGSTAGAKSVGATTRSSATR